MGIDVPTVPAPEPPDSGDAWYAPAVHDQYEVVPGVVATVRGDGEPFAYDVREPSLSAGAREDLESVREHFADAELSRPRTREGAAERYRDGFDRKYELAIDRLVDCAPAERRRLDYHALAELKCLGELTPLALDDAGVQSLDGEVENVYRLLTDDAEIEQTREEKAEIDTKLAELREKRSRLEDVRYELDTEKESLESLRRERMDVESELESLPETPVGQIEEIDDSIDRLRTQKQRLDAEINELQSVVGFNQDMLEESNTNLLTSLEESNDASDVTDELLPNDEVSCWTCGSTVEAEQIETTIEKLQDLSREKLAESNDIDEQLEELKDQRRNLQDQQPKREQLQERRTDLEDEIEETESNIEELSDRKESLREEIGEIEAAVDEMENDVHQEILDLHKEANQLEYELGKLEGDLERVEGEIQEIEARLDDESELKDRKAELNEEIESLRTRIEWTEQEAIEKFNEHMDDVLELLGYRNIERIWLERSETRVREGRRKVTRSVFDLHVVRKTDGGTTYEDTVDNLSESEREVTGLIFALAGYLTHDVYETVPFMLLDSLEVIDSERIARLVDYVADFSSYLVVALFPEDAAALDDDYKYITEI